MPPVESKQQYYQAHAIDCAKAAHARGVKTVSVSSGYMTAAARRDCYAYIDAVNIDLKAFTETFYHGICFSHLEPVLDTLRWLRHETDVWLEVPTLLIPVLAPSAVGDVDVSHARQAFRAHSVHSTGHENCLGCNSLHRNVLASHHQQQTAQAPMDAPDRLKSVDSATPPHAF